MPPGLQTAAQKEPPALAVGWKAIGQPWPMVITGFSPLPLNTAQIKGTSIPKQRWSPWVATRPPTAVRKPEPGPAEEQTDSLCETLRQALQGGVLRRSSSQTAPAIQIRPQLNHDRALCFA